jgi:hypothetical protein
MKVLKYCTVLVALLLVVFQVARRNLVVRGAYAMPIVLPTFTLQLVDLALGTLDAGAGTTRRCW